MKQLCQILKCCRRKENKYKVITSLAREVVDLRILVKSSDMLCQILKGCDGKTQKLILEKCADKYGQLTLLIDTKEKFRTVRNICKNEKAKNYFDSLCNDRREQDFNTVFFKYRPFKENEVSQQHEVSLPLMTFSMH